MLTQNTHKSLSNNTLSSLSKLVGWLLTVIIISATLSIYLKWQSNPTINQSNNNLYKTNFSSQPFQVKAASTTQNVTVQNIPSNNTFAYATILIEEGHNDRLLNNHADLALKLRNPEPIEVDLTLIDLPNVTVSDAPKLNTIFKSNFQPTIIGAYDVHEWNMQANRPKSTLAGGVLIEVSTVSGEAVFIPAKQQAIYQGEYYATVLYATDDSLTFVYANQGNVSEGYTVYYQGLQTDPDLVDAFLKSEGNNFPALTLDAPIGTATDSLTIAIRNNGEFMDARSRKDFWQ